MANVTAQEQLMLELVNRARMDPAAEAARFGMTLNQGIPAGSISETPKQVLAMNDTLGTAADRHSEYMHLNDEFSHQEVPGRLGFSGVNPSDRLIAAGYNGATSQGENIAFWGEFPGPVNLTSAIIQQHEGLFRSTTGHRQNLLLDTWREVGIGQKQGSFAQNGTQYDSSLVTQNFAYRGAGYFLTGVVYQDTIVNDDFYTVGEGQGNVSVSIDGGFADVSSSAGGYETAMTNGAHTVAIGVAVVTLQMANRNIKLDFVNGNQLWTDTSLTLVSGAGDVRLLGATNANLTGSANGEQLVGNRGNNILSGNGGNDTLFGLDGSDTLSGGDLNDTLVGGAGADSLNGGPGNDIYNVGSEATLDAITDASGADAIYTSIGRSLVSLGSIENILLQGTNPISAIGNGAANGMTGNGANNYLYGQSGNDTILGGGGGDQIYGQGGKDAMTGGTGRDTFVYQSAAETTFGFGDTISDFDDFDDDFIDLRQIPGLTSFIGTNPFTAPGQVRMEQSGAHVLIQMNTAGPNGPEGEITLLNTTIGTGVGQVNGGDFFI